MKSLVFKNFLINASGILFSRILGLIRDMLIALYLGAGLYSDIFFVALKMPAFFRRIFAEGAFAQSFLPNFTKAAKKGAFCLAVLWQFSIIVFLFCLLVSFFSGFFTRIFALGFDEHTLALAAPLVAINFWYLFFIFLVTFLGALLNYRQGFFISSFSASLFNLSIVIAALFVDKAQPQHTLYYFSYATVLSGLAQLILHCLALVKNPVLKAMWLSLGRAGANLRGFYRSFFHGLLGSSASQLSSLLDTTIASFLVTGSISYLYYSNRIFQLPLALFAIALSQVSFPKILRQLKSGQEAEAMIFMRRALGWLSLLLLLAAITGGVFAEEIISLLFERGHFSAHDTRLTALALIAYLAGLLPFGLQKLFSLWLYAKLKQKQAATIAIKALLISAAISIILILLIPSPDYKVLAIALASSISGLYLLAASVGEFGWGAFVSLLSFRKIFLGLAGLGLFGLGLFWAKPQLLEFGRLVFDFFKGSF